MRKERKRRTSWWPSEWGEGVTLRASDKKNPFVWRTTMDPQFKRGRESDQFQSHSTPPEFWVKVIFAFQVLFASGKLSQIYLWMHRSKCDNNNLLGRDVRVSAGSCCLRKWRINAFDRKSIFPLINKWPASTTADSLTPGHLPPVTWWRSSSIDS